MPPAHLDRRFSVRARHVDDHHAKHVSEASFEAAAIAFVEDLPVSVDEDSEIRVIVRDLDSGHERCFRVDLDSGDAAPCG
jgi:hypothetical protein